MKAPPPVPTPPIAMHAPNAARRARRSVGAAVLLIPIALVVLGGLWVWAMTKWSYSSGERAGWVQKFSRKGWICKTWEGELALVTMPGTAQEKFYFTVWDDEVANRINAAMGKRVSLHYDEKVGLPGSCFGETRHWVNGVKAVDEIPLAPGIVVPTPGPLQSAPAQSLPTPSASPQNPPAPSPPAQAAPAQSAPPQPAPAAGPAPPATQPAPPAASSSAQPGSPANPPAGR